MTIPVYCKPIQGMRKYFLLERTIPHQIRIRRVVKRLREFRRVSVSFTLTGCLLVLMCLLSAGTVSAQEENGLRILIYDTVSDFPMEDNIFIEGKEYHIVVGYDNDSGYAIGATVTVPWITYQISEEMRWIPIEGPVYEDYEQFVITATQEGYAPAELLITVIKGELSIEAYPSRMEEQDSIQLTVKDQDGLPVEDVLVFLEINGPDSDSANTDAEGVAYLTAPWVDHDSEIVIKAYKVGYDIVSASVFVENIQLALVFNDIMSLAPIIAALLVVLFAMVFVRVRKKKARSTMYAEVNPNPTKWNSHKGNGSSVSVNPTPKAVSSSTSEQDAAEPSPTEPKIEEIRIHRSEKRKETTVIPDEKEHPEPDTQSIKDDWFNGTDDIRYKIDKLTGEIDEKNIDKWFEGIDDIRSKIDETIDKKLDKKHKKKKEE